MYIKYITYIKNIYLYNKIKYFTIPRKRSRSLPHNQEEKKKTKPVSDQALDTTYKIPTYRKHRGQRNLLNDTMEAQPATPRPGEAPAVPCNNVL